MFLNVSKWSTLSGFGLLGLCLTLGGCKEASSDAPPDEASAPVGSLEAALEAPMLKCGQTRSTCVGESEDATVVDACNTKFQSCLGEAAKRGQELASELGACRDQAGECVEKAGETGTESCRTDFQACVEGVIGTPALPAAGGPARPRLPRAGSPSPRLPRQPAAGERSLPRLPLGGARAFPVGGRGSAPVSESASKLIECFSTLRTCVSSEEDPNECLTAARSCVQGALASDGAAGTEAKSGD